MKMNLASLSDKAGWEKAGVTLPAYDVEKMAVGEGRRHASRI